MEMWNSLTELRKQSGLSQQELAEALDVSRQAVSRWETGASAPSTEKLIELARLYGVPLDELVNGYAPDVGSAATNESPRRKIQWGWVVAAALALILATVIAAWSFHDGGERNDEIINEEDMQEEVVDVDEFINMPG